MPVGTGHFSFLSHHLEKFQLFFKKGLTNANARGIMLALSKDSRFP